MSAQGGKGGGAVQAPNLNSGGGKGILPPGSMSTQDLRPDGMSTTEFNFLEKHGKPFSEMTPEEQFAVQNPQPTRVDTMSLDLWQSCCAWRRW